MEEGERALERRRPLALLVELGVLAGRVLPVVPILREEDAEPASLPVDVQLAPHRDLGRHRNFCRIVLLLLLRQEQRTERLRLKAQRELDADLFRTSVSPGQ